MARRVKVDTRKLKEPDEFLSTSQRAYAWVAERRRPVLYTILAVVAIVIVTRGLATYKRTSAIKAQNLLYQTMKLQFAPPGAALPTDLVLQRYNEILRRYPRTPVAPIVKLQVGNVLYSQESYAESAARFTEVLRGLPADHPLRDLALLNLAYCYHASAQVAEAITTAQKVLDDPQSPVRDYAAFAIVRWERQRGNTVKAQEALQFIRNNFPGSPFLERLTEAETVAATTE